MSRGCWDAVNTWIQYAILQCHVWHQTPANTRHWTNVWSMFSRRRKRRANIDPILVQCLVFAGTIVRYFFTINYKITWVLTKCPKSHILYSCLNFVFLFGGNCISNCLIKIYVVFLHLKPAIWSDVYICLTMITFCKTSISSRWSISPSFLSHKLKKRWFSFRIQINL